MTRHNVISRQAEHGQDHPPSRFVVVDAAPNLAWFCTKARSLRVNEILRIAARLDGMA